MEGPLGLYKGLGAALCAAVPGWAVFFGGYETMKQLFELDNVIKEAMCDDTPLKTKLWNVFLLGNCSGLACQFSWLSSYPADVVNNIIKCDTRVVTPRIRDVVRSTYRRQGIRGFYRGLVPCLMFAHLTCGIVMPLYEYINNKLDPQIED